MNHAFLPHAGETWLCKTEGQIVTPLCRAPGETVAVRKFSADRTQFGILDQTHKRTATYRLLDQEPWFQVELLPVTLPRNCLAHDFIIHENCLIVGGHGKEGEALWMRNSDSMRGWASISLPEGVRRKGKSIDALFIHDDNLVAVDNIVLPKWILQYPLRPTISVQTAKKIPLRAHNSYEHVVMGAEGSHMYALYSRGFNHGASSYHISLLEKSGCNEVFAFYQVINQTPSFGYSFDPDLDDIEDDEDVIEGRKTKSTNKPESYLHDILPRVKDMAFSGGKLFLAAGELGLVSVEVDRPVRGDSVAAELQSSDVQRRALETIHMVASIEVNHDGSGGIYAVGTDMNGSPAFELVSDL